MVKTLFSLCKDHETLSEKKREEKKCLHPVNKRRGEGEDIVREKLSIRPHDEINKAKQRDQVGKKNINRSRRLCIKIIGRSRSYHILDCQRYQRCPVNPGVYVFGYSPYCYCSIEDEVHSIWTEWKVIWRKVEKQHLHDAQ